MKEGWFTSAIPVITLATALVGTVSRAEASAPTFAQGCTGPNSSAPSLSFSIITYQPGELRAQCKSQIEKGIQMGMTSVAIIPAFAYDTAQEKILPPEASLERNELTECLDAAWSTGLGIVYDPHVEALSLIHRQPNAPWRATFNFSPSTAYAAIYSEFEGWLTVHAGEILHSNRPVDVILASEYEASTTKRADEWLQFVDHFHLDLIGLGLLHRVRMGYDPNWWPMNNPSLLNTLSFDEFLGFFDFLAPSFYGDWSKVEEGDKQVANQRAGLYRRLTHRGPLRAILGLRSLPFAVGEFGTGARLDDSVTNHLIDAHELGFPEFMRSRRKLYANLINWMKTQKRNKGEPLFVNLWSQGIFDPAGITPFSMHPDPEISKMFIDYTRWRCAE